MENFFFFSMASGNYRNTCTQVRLQGLRLLKILEFLPEIVLPEHLLEKILEELKEADCILEFFLGTNQEPEDCMNKSMRDNVQDKICKCIKMAETLSGKLNLKNVDDKLAEALLRLQNVQFLLEN